MKVLDLFAGIGGFSLGLERTGHFTTAAFCEVNEKACAVLRKNWPHIPIYNDVRELTGEQLKKDGISVDVITGGFPCQDISMSGLGAGLAGERSGLWSEFHRIIKEITPKWVIIENVSALRSRGLEEVLRGLSEVGYDAEWHCIPASALGAPHQRDRIWIIAYPMCLRTQVQAEGDKPAEQVLGSQSEAWRAAANAADWSVEPCLGGVAYGLPGRVDRVNQLGNAVVPQIVEIIGNAIALHKYNTSGDNPHQG
jgi:DNA (cytosine-5)-methyltransferase 1